MNTKKLVFMALLIAVGAALYIVIPGINGGMKPDFMLTMMIIGILLFPDVKSVFLLAVTTGLISGLFSSFPGGFIPNVIDKFIYFPTEDTHFKKCEGRSPMSKWVMNVGRC